MSRGMRPNKRRGDGGGERERERERENKIVENSNEKEKKDSQRVFPSSTLVKGEREKTQSLYIPAWTYLNSSTPSTTIPFHTLSLFILSFSLAPSRAV